MTTQDIQDALARLQHAIANSAPHVAHIVPQAAPDWNAEMERQRTATMNAQALADQYKDSADRERARADKLERELNRLLPDDFDSLEAYIKTLNEENTNFTYQAAEAHRLLRAILDTEQLCNCGPYFRDAEDMERRIRAILDDPPGAEARWRDIYRNDAKTAHRIAELETELTDLRTELTRARQLADVWHKRADTAPSSRELEAARSSLAALRTAARDLCDGATLTPDCALVSRDALERVRALIDAGLVPDDSRAHVAAALAGEGS